MISRIASVELDRALGQLAHLRGDDREARAGLAGAGGLDRGVERQQVGLLGDLVDQLAGPRRSSGCARPARASARRSPGPAPACRASCRRSARRRRHGRALSAIEVAVDGQLLDRRRRLGHRRGLLARSRRRIPRRHTQLFYRRAEHLRRLAHARQQAPDDDQHRCDEDGQQDAEHRRHDRGAAGVAGCARGCPLRGCDLRGGLLLQGAQRPQNLWLAGVERVEGLARGGWRRSRRSLQASEKLDIAVVRCSGVRDQPALTGIHSREAIDDGVEGRGLAAHLRSQVGRAEQEPLVHGLALVPERGGGLLRHECAVPALRHGFRAAERPVVARDRDDHRGREYGDQQGSRDAGQTHAIVGKAVRCMPHVRVHRLPMVDS